MRVIMLPVLTLAGLLVACGGPPNFQTNNEITINGQLGVAGARWLRVGAPYGATELGTPIGFPGARVRASACSSFDDSTFAALDQDLANIHNQLVNKDTPVNVVHAWVRGVEQTPEFDVTFEAQESGGEVGGRVAVYDPVSINASLNGTTTSAALLISNTQRRLRLSASAAQCMEKNTCLASRNAGGSYVTEALYGTMLRLGIQNAEFHFAAGGGIPDASLTFSLSSENISLSGGLIGDVAADIIDPSGIAREYDVPEIIADLNSNRLLRVRQRMEERTSRYGIIGVVVQQVSAERCAELPE